MEYVKVYRGIKDKNVPKDQQEECGNRRHFCGECSAMLWAYDPKWPQWCYPFASAIDTDLPVSKRPVCIMLKHKANWAQVPSEKDADLYDEYPDESLEEWHKPSSTEITVIDLEVEDDNNIIMTDAFQSQLSQPQQPSNSMSITITQNEQADQEAQITASPRVFPNYLPPKASTPTPSTPTNIPSVADSSNTSTPEQLKNTTGEKRHVQVARSYENLAKKHNWVNANGSYFPISVDSLCSFIRHKADTSTIKSIDWYVGALKKYHITELGIKDWDDVRKNPKVRSALAEIEEEASAKIRKDRTHGESDMSVGNKGKQSIISNDANASRLSPVRSAHNYSTIYSSHIGSSVRGSGSKNVPRLDPANRPAEAILAMLGVMDSADEDTEKVSKSKSPNNVINIDSDDDAAMTSRRVGSSSTLSNSHLVSLRRRRRNLQYAEPEDEDEDDEDYLPPKGTNNGVPYVPTKKRRKRDLEMNMPHVDPDEPESFKFRYDYAITILKSKYIGQCTLHPKGCFEVQPDLHVELNENMFRHWASLIASGDDVSEEKLPDFQETPEFHQPIVKVINI
ncbi:4529_t:CDS:10 [Ambispora leptoticha]|uniref:4529_t:CDS:1 n=1 Tax=Ambispora leptoticha TaxID=144679 RepID=A0A9N9B533_9GLOM|nr:4529_t:CDS:10 [Ambispora leptoticha]